MKVAVISDVHSNNTALKSIVNIISGFAVDRVVFLGDLLTYGCAVKETVTTLLKMSSDFEMSFVKGNHDQIYFDLQKGQDFQYKPFPDFILESVLYTAGKMDFNLESIFDWKESICIHNVYFSHANALGYGNWGYLNSDSEVLSTCGSIVEGGYVGGVFGHTHRPMFFLSEAGELTHVKKGVMAFQPHQGRCFVANSGSVGQPRGGLSSFLLIELCERKVTLKHIFFEYDLSLHLNSINRSSLSVVTKQKLISYFL